MTITDPNEFKRFHTLITKNHPDYEPFYIPLCIRGKDPLPDMSWEKSHASFEKAYHYLELGHNIGIVARANDRLVIMDKDDIEAVGATKPTLTTISRKRYGGHGFYFTDELAADGIDIDTAKMNMATDTYGEIRAYEEYVVCAGSYVPVLKDEVDDVGASIWDKIPDNEKVNAGKYTIHEPNPVASITFKEIPEVYTRALIERRTAEKNPPPEPVIRKYLPTNGDKNKTQLFDLTIGDVTGKKEDGSHRFPSLFHGSATGMNTSISQGVMTCWRHSVSHSPMTALAVAAGLGTCSSLGYRFRARGSSAIDLKDGETQFKLWEYAKKNKLIPHDDPIPSKALVYFAKTEKLCLDTDIVDGWKLPTPVYNQAIQKMHVAGIIPGRQPFIPKQENQQPTVKPTINQEPIIKTCGDCVFGTKKAGNCKNPDIKDESTKSKLKRIVFDSPACDKLKAIPDKEQKKQDKKKSQPIDSETIYTDMRNSKKLAQLVGNNARYCSAWKSWVVFNKTRWEKDNSGMMLRYARQVVIELQKEAMAINDFEKKKDAVTNALKCEATPRLKSMVELCQSEPGMTISEEIFDNDPMLFNLQNGTLNLKTGQLQKHNQLDYQMKISPVVFDSNAKCERWHQFLDEALSYTDSVENDIKKKNIIGYLKRHSGYSTTGMVNEEQFLILFGDGGHGKSKYIGAITYVLGEYHGKVEVQTIQETLKTRDGSSPTPDVAKLKGLRFITCSEPEKGLKLNESRVKDFTGRDPITCRGLHESPFTFTPQFKLGIYTNYRIIIRGQDKSIWRRVHQIGFDKEPKKIDKDLDKKLQSEASGILNWMLEGCLEWQKDGLNVPQEIKDDVAEYKDEMDVLSEFFSLCCEYEKGNKKITSYGNDLFHVYQAWWNVDNRNNAPYFRQQFLDAISERGFKKIKKDMRGVVIGGIKLKIAVGAAYEDVKSIYDGYKNDAMTAMTSFLVNFCTVISRGKKPENYVSAVIPSFKLSGDNGYKRSQEQKVDLKVKDDRKKEPPKEETPIRHYSIHDLAHEATEHITLWDRPNETGLCLRKEILIDHLSKFDHHNHTVRDYEKICEGAFVARQWMMA